MNSQDESIQIHDVFLNVRKAYRLLHDYQRMVRDAVLYISAHLDIEFDCGRAMFADDAIQGYRKLSQPSWDWLPMMSCEFCFLKRLGEECWSLSFFIISDTGFVEGDDKENNKEVLSSYASADKSSTKFAFIMRKGHWGYTRPFMNNKTQMRNFVKAEGSLPDDLIKEGIVGKCYDMANLASESETNEIIKKVIEIAEKSWHIGLKKNRSTAIQT